MTDRRVSATAFSRPRHVPRNLQGRHFLPMRRGAATVGLIPLSNDHSGAAPPESGWRRPAFHRLGAGGSEPSGARGSAAAQSPCRPDGWRRGAGFQARAASGCRWAKGFSQQSTIYDTRLASSPPSPARADRARVSPRRDTTGARVGILIASLRSGVALGGSFKWGNRLLCCWRF